MKNKKNLLWTIAWIIILLLAIWIVYKLKYTKTESNIEKVTFSTWVVNEVISKNFVKFTHTLNLSSKKLSSIPDICTMVKWSKYEYDIWVVDLSNNWFNSFDKDLSCLKNLSELNISFNNLDKIDNLGKLTFLSKLDIWNNKLVSISWLENLTRLSDLHLWYNQIKTTKGLEKLVNLKSLKLQHNLINDLSWISSLNKLQELKLEYNELTDNNLKQIPYIDKLKIITLAENKISKSIVDKYNAITLKHM